MRPQGRGQVTTPTSDCCGKPLAMAMDDGGVHEAFCKDCSEEICSGCAGQWEPDAGEEPGSVRVIARCQACAGAREEARWLRMAERA